MTSAWRRVEILPQLPFLPEQNVDHDLLRHRRDGLEPRNSLLVIIAVAAVVDRIPGRGAQTTDALCIL